MKYRLPSLLLFLCLIGLSLFHLSFYAERESDDIQLALQRAIGKRVELVLIECEIKPHSKYIVTKIEDGFCLFTCADSTRNASDIQSITLPIERILTLRELSKDTFKLTAL
jgi:hypothetical protein